MDQQTLNQRENLLIENDIAKFFAKPKYNDETDELIIMNQEEMCNALEARYSSGPDSEDQRDEDGPYHFENFSIDKINRIYQTYLSYMEELPATRRRVSFGRVLNFDDGPEF
jgi:hypothetical protein